MQSLLDLLLNLRPETSTYSGSGYPTYSPGPTRLPSLQSVQQGTRQVVNKIPELAVRGIPALIPGPLGAGGSYLGDTAWEKISGNEIDPNDKLAGAALNLEPSLWGDISKAGLIFGGGLGNIGKGLSASSDLAENYLHPFEQTFGKTLSVRDKLGWNMKMFGTGLNDPKQITKNYITKVMPWLNKTIVGNTPELRGLDINPVVQPGESIDKVVSDALKKKLGVSDELQSRDSFLENLIHATQERYNTVFGNKEANIPGAYKTSYTAVENPVKDISVSGDSLVADLQNALNEPGKALGKSLREPQENIYSDIIKDTQARGNITPADLSKTISGVGEQIGNLNAKGETSQAANNLYGILKNARNKVYDLADPTKETSTMRQALDTEYGTDKKLFEQNKFPRFFQLYSGSAANKGDKLFGGVAKGQTLPDINNFIKLFTSPEDIKTLSTQTGKSASDIRKGVTESLLKKSESTNGIATRMEGNLPGSQTYQTKKDFDNINVSLDQAHSAFTNKQLQPNLKYLYGDEYDKASNALAALNTVKAHNRAVHTAVKLDSNGNIVINSDNLLHIIQDEPALRNAPEPVKQAYQYLHSLSKGLGDQPSIMDILNALNPFKKAEKP